MERREFLKMGIVAGAAVAASALPAMAEASYTEFTLEDCLKLTPQQMAENSGAVMASWKYIQNQAAGIKNPMLRRAVLEITADPAPKLLNVVSGRKKDVYNEFEKNGWITDISYDAFLPENGSAKKANQPFYTAPGSGYSSHHCYPGGLATHTALNVEMSLALYSNYGKIYGFNLDRDVVVAAQILHDLHKPWVFQWQQDGSCRGENKLAGTGEHHVLGVAESVVRGLPADVCVAQACAHNHPGFSKDEEAPVRWLKAAAVIADVDPVEYGLLAKDGMTLPLQRSMEAFVTHLGDHDWILTVPAVKWIIPVMEEIAMQDYGMNKAELNSKKFHAFRNAVFSQATVMNLYHLMQKDGKAALRKQVNAIVKA
ncbi:metal-dependent phosphohydrolase [Maridesulfovibrio sp.]|uniref:metal-dependent phosphohydrolase n=1 Tax=Maridesulfovibrio sp. TaxID=2795000 RepID=UPI0029F56441|nr:metal-dependent phosphohydrolase [Maridesulfovibrio sp.]